MAGSQTRAGIDFEPVVEFPDKPFDAARIFLAVMAYPERGAGQPNGLGVPFVEALWNYVVWEGRRARGLNFLRQKFGDASFMPPRKREFEGALNRGLRRLQRRNAAYSLIGTQLFHTFFNINKGALSLQELIRSNPERWSERLSLNATNARRKGLWKPANAEQHQKDIFRRGFLQSRPVLHMAHALSVTCGDIGPQLDGWDEWDPILVLLWNSDRWVWGAIDAANDWRIMADLNPKSVLNSSQMIELVAPKSAR